MYTLHNQDHCVKTTGYKGPRALLSDVLQDQSIKENVAGFAGYYKAFAVSR